MPAHSHFTNAAEKCWNGLEKLGLFFVCLFVVVCKVFVVVVVFHNALIANILSLLPFLQKFAKRTFVFIEIMLSLISSWYWSK